ncbi:hypothetical protein MmiHf6_07980 [Methanimicrococcus hongohii]|uniref:Abortive phage infection protein C-terminal domain-containing protein n=1 Tax=Methanimicrococcus hongohii TaxID=3028295 RepID=A0AA96V8P0_9EURY|nr:AIPR family protein [Methanimicrococcus sp. Hf6]WNY23491.1 hypothetical protein MmiHf6_07980 [Methanimicrococcus sp. Hf6]
MILKPIIQGKLKKYKIQSRLETISDDIVFERFVNQTILSSHQPDAFNTENEILENICIGGQDDMGLDGICIKLNGNLISTISEAKDLIETRKTADIEFIFIQSKFKESFDSGEYLKFTSGVHDFLSFKHIQPRNEKIDEWIQLKDYLFSEEVLVFWPQQPNVRLYYVSMGNWDESKYPHIIAHSEKLKDDIENLNSYDEIAFNYIDYLAFKKIIDENDNCLKVTLHYLDSTPLPEVKNINDSSIVLLPADSLLNMLKSDEGLIRKTLFTDNVRDYQGDTTINSEILETLNADPESFMLLNNGITIVCDEIVPANRKITIKNPQIVNGCQTCNVIYHAHKMTLDLSSVVISAKIISTNDYEIINQIVKGTNRQNIVYDEAFEVTKPFHKELEELFISIPLDDENERIYYERRSKQYSSNTAILQHQKINFKVLIQSFVSVFLKEPHKGHRHESKLLQDYQNKIFIENQSKYPYYISSLIFVKVEKLFRDNKIEKTKRPSKAQLSMLIKEKAGPNCPDINNEKEISKYCQKLLSVLVDEKEFINTVNDSVEQFNKIKNEWITIKGTQYKSAIKDSAEFNSYLYNKISGTTNLQDMSSYRGTIIKSGYDRYGRRYGFISKQPRNIFFHETKNNEIKIIDFDNLLYKEVLYDTEFDHQTSSEHAINIKFL